MRQLLALAAACVLAASASAQSYVFDLQQGSSNFTWSGTTSLGALQGNPSNQFQLTGTTTMSLVLQTGAQPVASASFLSGAAMAVPDIHGRIPNPIPGFPPLATIDVLGLVLSPTSPSFPVAGGGSFSTTITLTATAGTMNVTPLVGSPSSTPLAGSVSNPTPVTGSMALNATALRFNLPVNTTFAFSDPGTGATGTITVVGTVVGDFGRVRIYCAGDGSGTACPCGNSSPAGSGRGCLNSTGTGAQLTGSGLAIASADTFVLSASGMPATATALYFQGTSESNGGAGTVFGDGKRCAAGTIVRLGTKASAAGASAYPQVGDPSVSVRGLVPATGGVRTYQVWYRNAVAFCTPDTFNLSNGLRVLWLP